MGKNKLPKTTLDWAKEYIMRGWPVLPCYAVTGRECNCPPDHKMRHYEDKETGREWFGACKSPGKHPHSQLAPRGSHSATTDILTISRWFENNGEFNIAVATGHNNQGNLMVVDIDVRDGKAGPATWAELEAELGPFGETLAQTTGSGGRQLFFWTDTEVPLSAGKKLGPGIDVRGKGGYVVVPPSANDLGDYSWENWGSEALTAPKALEERAILGKEKPRPASRPVTGAPRGPVTDHPHDRLTLAQVQELLKSIPAGSRDNWLALGFTLRTIAEWIGGESTAFEVWDAWAQTGDGYGGLKDQEKHWESFAGKPTEHPIAILRGLARDHNWTPSQEFTNVERLRWKGVAQEMLDALPDDAEPDSEAFAALVAVLSRLPEMTRDDFLGKIRKRFKSWRVTVMRDQVERHRKQRTEAEGSETDYAMMVVSQVLAKHFDGGKRLLRTADKSFWRYNGRCWEVVANEEEIGNLCLEETRKLGAIKKDFDTVAQQAINLLRKLQARAGDPLRLSEPPAPVINCQNGELWIQSDGSVKLQDHNPDSFLRFCLDIEYDPQATCPLFDAALLAIFQKSPNPEDMRRHLYEVFGYAIQPDRYIKQFWLWEGDGDNGKTAVVDTLCKLVGSQSFFPADIQKIGHEYYISHLKTKLILRDDDVNWSTVLPDGPLKQLSEAKVVLGRDPHGKPKEFVSCVLPILLCNKFPITKDLSRGVLTRAHIISFRHSFEELRADGSPGDMDRGLFKRIWNAELPGILNRSIEGLRRLRERGRYQEPEDCLRAKEEFLKKANPFPRFIAEACTTLEQLRRQVRVSELSKHFENAEALPDTLAEGFESVEDIIVMAMAKAESEGLRQPLNELYKQFCEWADAEGIRMYHKPTRADVENYLFNLRYRIVVVHNQKWVEGVRALAPM